MRFIKARFVFLELGTHICAFGVRKKLTVELSLKDLC